MIPSPRCPTRTVRLLGLLAVSALAAGCGGSAPPPAESPPVTVAPLDASADTTAVDGTDDGGAAAGAAVADGASQGGAVGGAPGGGANGASGTPGPLAVAGPLGYAPVWEAKDPGGWNHALAFASSGDVVSLSAFSLSVLARHDGARLDHARVCSSIAIRGTALEVRGQSVLVVCSDAVQDIELPGMRRTERLKLPWDDMDARATSCGFGPSRLAVGNRAGEVIEIDLKSWRIVARHQAPSPGEIESLAYTPDGSALAVSVDAEMGTPGQIVLLRNGRFERVPNVADSSGAIAFSPNGRELFGEVRSFTAGRVSIVDGRVGNEQHVSSWLTAARWIDDGLVAATGAHGTALFPPSGDVVTLNKQTGEGLAVSKDGKLLCSGARDGQIRCWSKGPVTPSSYRPIGAAPSDSAAGGANGVATPSGSAASGTGAAPGGLHEHAGTLRSRSGSRVVIELGAEPAPAAGTKGELSKRVATDFGGLSITAWLTIAEVTVEKATGKQVTVRIDKMTSQVNVNGKPVDHFTAGSEVRLAVQ